MTPRRAAIVVGCVAAVAAVVLLVRPLRFVVDGLSMAPGLMPGDVVATGWLPAARRLGPPRRFDRWVVVPPNGTVAVKRVAGLPGEEVAIRDGDLVVHGAIVVKEPAVLADMAVPLAIPLDAPRGRAILPADEVLDDVAFAREVNRPLEPVHDTGISALIATGPAEARLRLTLDGTTLTWRLPAAARVQLIAGRLDGRVVAVAWRERTAGPVAVRPSGLPVRVPKTWAFTAERTSHPAAASAPGGALVADGHARIEAITAWRDVHLRPAADGTASWRLDDAAYLVLGDFPTGSLDSRHWGPLPRAALLHPVARRP